MGMPNVNFKCLVLCLDTIIPIKPPKDPPRNDKNNNLFSGILHFLFFALLLSEIKLNSVIIFIKTKYKYSDSSLLFIKILINNLQLIICDIKIVTVNSLNFKNIKNN